MRDNYLYRCFVRELSDSDKREYRECSINQQKDWYISYLENRVLTKKDN